MHDDDQQKKQGFLIISGLERPENLGIRSPGSSICLNLVDPCKPVAQSGNRGREISSSRYPRATYISEITIRLPWSIRTVACHMEGNVDLSTKF